MIILRSALFNVLFYLNLTALLILALPTFLFPTRHGILFMAQLWGRTSLWLLRVVCGIRYQIRGREKLQAGGILVAAKHQSTWETFALLPELSDFSFIIKRELMWIPVFGWFTVKAQMVPIDRSAGAQTMAKMLAHARRALGEERQIVIFPEGTRRAAGAEPAYKFGIARLYDELEVPCVPVALNSGLFWPRRKFLRYPGTIVVEVLDPIAPGLAPKDFIERLEREIEAATARLIEEGRRERATAAARAPSGTVRGED